MSDFSDLINRAAALYDRYKDKDIKRCGREWTGSEQALGFVTDVGELAELVLAKDGVRDRGDNIDTRLAHELSDCLWSVIVIANHYGVDLESEFIKTMNQLDEKLAA